MKNILAMLLILGGSTLQLLHGDQLDDSATGLTSPTSTVTFLENGLYPTDTEITNQFSSLGVTFSPYTYYDPFALGFNSLGNFNSTATDVLDSFQMNFSSVLNGAAVYMIDDPVTITALLGGNPVDQFAATSDLGSGGWFGFQNENFDTLQFDFNGTGGALLMVAGNPDSPVLQISVAPVSTPETSQTWMLLAIAGALVAFGSRRKAVNALN